MSVPVARAVARPVSPNALRGMWVGLILAGWFAALFIPWEGVFRHRTCPFFHLTNLPCPACGMTRACVFTAHGDWFPALLANPLGPAMMAASVITLGVLAVLIATNAPRWPVEDYLRDRPWIRVAAAAILILNWAGQIARSW
ncbi:MAG: DUF2752 domain-containing protein [Deltaproteobacteria bacterium]|nr:DUF2752 domain-containing protein [Deltaproteobacteria bacterium]